MGKTSEEWDQMHLDDNRPWDLKGVTPILKHFIENLKGEMKNPTRILVPGCGQVYDSEYLGKVFPEAEVIGLDVSPTAVASCNRENTMKNVKFIVEDFFESEVLGPPFDFVFDHTFFCAIDPELREKWGNRMGSLVGRSNGEGGHLLTLIYPLELTGNSVKGQPPFQVSYEAYEQVLKGDFECVGRWQDNLPESNEKRRGREELALFKRK